MDQAVGMLIARANAGGSAYACVANLKTTTIAQRDTVFCEVQNNSFLTVPDGMPLVWCARILGEANAARITGPDLLMEVLRRSREHGLSHYFYGDTEETLAEISRRLGKCFPELEIKGMYSPPFRTPTDEDTQAAIAEINRLQPSFIWVGLGAPKQEKWVARVHPHVHTGMFVGVGAAFRFVAGEYRHPPRFLQQCGLEGFFWRGRRRPLDTLIWLARHAPACGLLLLDALRRRIQRSRHSQCAAVSSESIGDGEDHRRRTV